MKIWSMAVGKRVRKEMPESAFMIITHTVRLENTFLRWFYKVKINEVLICELRLQKQKIRKQMPSWTPRNLQTLQNLPLHFQIDLKQAFEFFPPIGSQVCLEAVLCRTRDLRTHTRFHVSPHPALEVPSPLPRNISSKQVPSPGLEWAVVTTAAAKPCKNIV